MEESHPEISEQVQTNKHPRVCECHPNDNDFGVIEFRCQVVGKEGDGADYVVYYSCFIDILNMWDFLSHHRYGY